MRENPDINSTNLLSKRKADTESRRMRIAILSNGLKTSDEVRKTMNTLYSISMSYSMISKDYSWLIKKGYIEDLSKGTNKFKCFKQTSSAFHWFQEVEKTKKIDLPNIQNPKNTFIIPIEQLDLVEKIIKKEEYGFKEVRWNNGKRFNGEVEKYSVQITIYNDYIHTMIGTAPIYALDEIQLHHAWHQSAIEWCENLHKKWGIDYKNLSAVSNNQYTIRDPVMEGFDNIILKGDALRVQNPDNPNDFIEVDSSKGSETRVEGTRQQLADYLAMPFTMKKMVNVLEKLVGKQDVLIGAVKDIADSNVKTANILASLMESGQLKEKDVDTPPKKNRDHDRMFQ